MRSKTKETCLTSRASLNDMETTLVVSVNFVFVLGPVRPHVLVSRIVADGDGYYITHRTQAREGVSHGVFGNVRPSPG